ncbi:MAG: DNA polymerase III subunit gamma/tau C-terminal domain-containing protein, partial [bacterium]|nr:DNA polymerase III subunit gamma/tau C-terminal domain-containing protein [bacterium]
LSPQFSSEDVQLFYQIALKGREEIHLAPTLMIGFNMTMLRMLTFRPAPKAIAPPLAIQQTLDQNTSTIITPIKELKAETSAAIQMNPLVEGVNLAEGDETAIPLLAANLEKSCVTIEANNWASIIPELQLSGFALNAIENAEFMMKNDREVTLRVAKGHQSLFTPSTINRIETALSGYYQSPVKIILNSEEKVQASPAQQKEKATQQKQQIAENALTNDPVFQQLQDDFSAELVKNSIVPLKDDL